MLCNQCQIREATIHINMCSSREEEEAKSMDFCEECYDKSDFPGKSAMPTDFNSAFQAGCRFCGGEPYGGGRDPLALLAGVNKASILCKVCAEEYYGFFKEKLPGFGNPDLTKEQMAALITKLKACDFPALLAEQEKHMKEWVAKRKRP